MKVEIRNTARALGFASVGFTTALPIEARSHLEDAISSGRTASMKWLARSPEKRCDPKSLLPEARSVICLAYPYGGNGTTRDGVKSDGVSNSTPSDLTPSRVVRARFARGAEYHDCIRKKLEELWNSIKIRVPDARAKLCVDTSPLLEKALAERAGIGWIGKHTILLNEKLGSWFMLGEIVTDIEFTPDAPAQNLCGECTRCMDACPTGALLGKARLDARLCISYHTIESKEPAPPHIKKHLDEGRYGCDICQEACPYNP